VVVRGREVPRRREFNSRVDPARRCARTEICNRVDVQPEAFGELATKVNPADAVAVDIEPR